MLEGTLKEVILCNGLIKAGPTSRITQVAQGLVQQNFEHLQVMVLLQPPWATCSSVQPDLVLKGDRW